MCVCVCVYVYVYATSLSFIVHVAFQQSCIDRLLETQCVDVETKPDKRRRVHTGTGISASGPSCSKVQVRQENMSHFKETSLLTPEYKDEQQNILANRGSTATVLYDNLNMSLKPSLKLSIASHTFESYWNSEEMETNLNSEYMTNCNTGCNNNVSGTRSSTDVMGVTSFVSEQHNLVRLSYQEESLFSRYTENANDMSSRDNSLVAGTTANMSAHSSDLQNCHAAVSDLTEETDAREAKSSAKYLDNPSGQSTAVVSNNQQDQKATLFCHTTDGGDIVSTAENLLFDSLEDDQQVPTLESSFPCSRGDDDGSTFDHGWSPNWYEHL